MNYKAISTLLFIFSLKSIKAQNLLNSTINQTKTLQSQVDSLSNILNILTDRNGAVSEVRKVKILFEEAKNELAKKTKYKDEIYLDGFKLIGNAFDESFVESGRTYYWETTKTKLEGKLVRLTGYYYDVIKSDCEYDKYTGYHYFAESYIRLSTNKNYEETAEMSQLELFKRRNTVSIYSSDALKRDDMGKLGETARNIRVEASSCSWNPYYKFVLANYANKPTIKVQLEGYLYFDNEDKIIRLKDWVIISTYKE